MNNIAFTCWSPSLMTPLSIISLYKSLPSRVRSPTPAKTEKPPDNKWKHTEYNSIYTNVKEHLNKNTWEHVYLAHIYTMSLCDIVDKFHNKHSFSYTSTTKQSNLSSSLVWCKEINNLYEENHVRLVKDIRYLQTPTFDKMRLMHLQIPWYQSQEFVVRLLVQQKEELLYE